MAKIIWEPYDTFQVLSARTDPNDESRKPNNFDVFLYGIVLEDGYILIGKAQISKDDDPEVEDFNLSQMSARIDATGEWRVTKHRKLKDNYIPQAVPLDLNNQWVPAEVGLVLDAVYMTRPKPTTKASAPKKLKQ